MATVAETTNTKVPQDYPLTKSQTSSGPSKRCFGRGIAAALMVIPQILMNVGLGALKGLEVGTFAPGTFMNRKAKKIGTENGKLSAFCGHVGAFAGVIVGIAVAVPSLLIGAAFGLVKGIYNIHTSMKTYLAKGCSEAVHQVVDSYNINQRKIGVIAYTAIITVSTAILWTPFVLLSLPILAYATILPFTLGFTACNIALTYVYVTSEDGLTDQEAVIGTEEKTNASNVEI